MNFRGKNKSVLPGFQFAPMVDLVFILLTFFIASQIFSQWETEIDVKLPTAQTGQIPDRLPGEIIINILSDGEIVVNRQKMDEQGLSSILTRLAVLFPGQSVVVRADKKTAYEHVIKVLDVCRKADVWNIAFAAGPADAKPPASP